MSEQPWLRDTSPREHDLCRACGSILCAHHKLMLAWRCGGCGEMVGAGIPREEGATTCMHPHDAEPGTTCVWCGAAVPPLASKAASAWQGEVCKRCHRRNCVGFNLPDETWEAVVRGRWNVLCTTCFDEEAEAAGVRYDFGEVWPVSWSDW